MRILVVEDNRKHAEEAIAALSAAGMEVIHIETAAAGARYVRGWEHYEISPSILASREVARVDGVITDVFLPHNDKEPWNHGDDPCGIAVALTAEKNGIPVVLCTAGHHHGARLEWINAMGRWPMVDAASDRDGPEAVHKNWEKALQILLELIEEKEASK